PCEEKRSAAAENAHHGISGKLARITQRDGGNTEHGGGPPEGASHHHARDGREHDGTEHVRVPVANDFLDDEQNGGNRRIERRSQAGGRADWREESETRFRKTESAADERCHTGPDLERRIFRAQRKSTSDR